MLKIIDVLPHNDPMKKFDPATRLVFKALEEGLRHDLLCPNCQPPLSNKYLLFGDGFDEDDYE